MSLGKVFLAIGFLLLTLSPAYAKPETAPQDPKIVDAAKQWETAQTNYRDVLKEKRTAIEEEIKNHENMIENQDNKEERKKLMDRLKELLDDREALRDLLDIINAGEVVKLSNAKNKFITFFTKQ